MKSINGGAVASESYEASQAAISILNKGGNAVDAAIAAVAVQGVTRPYSGGVGGGGLIHLYLAKEKRFLILDHRVMSSSNFGPESIVNPDTGRAYPGSSFVSSTMSTAVPGAVKAWEEALEKYGTMTLHEVLQPAIAVAEKGFVVDQNFVNETEKNVTRFKLFVSTKKLYLDESGRPLKVGTIIKNPDFAKTYRLIAKHGSKVFYEGEIAEAIIDTIKNPPVVESPNFTEVDSEWDPTYGVIKGNMDLEDLKNYRIVTTNSTRMNYRGYDVYGAPPVSSGGITVGEVLNILEKYDLTNLPRSQAIHYYIEACRYAYADRSAYIGDPKFIDVPIKGLLSKDYATERRNNIKVDKASIGQVMSGDPWPYEKKHSQNKMYPIR
ncbi:gamma-glutamyltransferase [Ornithinibacillus sp. 4-3]|uniref:Gamma-glutamyltransferase n=1 Tax=Ornithinibacillus sp. 4-3 TaxID=3231488 RepID=A0AB39HV42_9BACI